MPRMSKENARFHKLTEEDVDFDEMLQLDENDSRHKELKSKLGAYKKDGKWHYRGGSGTAATKPERSKSIEGLRNAI